MAQWDHTDQMVHITVLTVQAQWWEEWEIYKILNNWTISNLQNKIKVKIDFILGKRVFEEYFKMMGGMRSMLELGFAGVAFYNFGSKAWSLFKKIILFLLKTSKSFLGFFLKFIPVDQIKTVIVASTGSKSDLKFNNLLISIIRVSVVVLLAISYKMRNSIKDEIFNKHE